MPSCPRYISYSLWSVYGHILCIYDQSGDIYFFGWKAKTKKKNLLLIAQLLSEERE